MEEYEILKTLCLSMAHINPDDINSFDKDMGYYRIYEKIECGESVGWTADIFEYKYDYLDADRLPPSFKDVIKKGLMLGVDCLNIDRDGPIAPGLPVYEW